MIVVMAMLTLVMMALVLFLFVILTYVSIKSRKKTKQIDKMKNDSLTEMIPEAMGRLYFLGCNRSFFMSVRSLMI